MRKINILKENREFSRIINNYKTNYFKYFNIYIEYNTDDYYKFGISVSKKIGNAVTRNKIKRQIKDIIDKKIYKNDFKCIIIVKKGILDLSYQMISDEIIYALTKLNIVKGDI